MARIESVSGLAAPATVAQIELSDPVTVTHISVADFGLDSEDNIAPAVVLVRLHGQPIGTVLVDAPGGTKAYKIRHVQWFEDKRNKRKQV